MRSMNAARKKSNREYKGKVHFTLKGIRFFGCLFLFGLFACKSYKNTKAPDKINAASALVRSGDIIFRNGKDEASAAARRFNKIDKTYSHAGIIEIEKDTIFVYHALGGAYNPSQQLMRQTLQQFCNPEEIDKFAVYRYPLSDLQRRRLKVIVNYYYGIKLAFDMFFNFYTDDKMYCSEFVFKSLNRASNDSLKFLLHLSAEPLYVSIDDLYLNKAATKVCEVHY